MITDKNAHLKGFYKFDTVWIKKEKHRIVVENMSFFKGLVNQALNVYV
jgi:hypothetical protein